MPFRWDGGGGATRSGGSIEGGMPAGPVSAAAASAAGDTHVTWYGRRRLPAVDHEVMALRLAGNRRSEEHTSELQSLMRISYAVFCLKKKNTQQKQTQSTTPKSSKTTKH